MKKILNDPFKYVDEMLDGEFDAVFLGTGAGVGNELGIEGENLTGVHRATDFLVRGNLEPDQLPENLRDVLAKPRNVAVIGGGDTSMDCVRTAMRLGAENVTCVYRRTEAEMLGRAEERINARFFVGGRLRILCGNSLAKFPVSF